MVCIYNIIYVVIFIVSFTQPWYCEHIWFAVFHMQCWCGSVRYCNGHWLQVLWWPLTSGTVMAIDFCLQQIKRERIVNVHGFVSKMSEQRNFMVQTEVSFTQLVWQPSQTPPLSLYRHLHPLTFLHTLATIHIHPLCPLGGYCGHFLRVTSLQAMSSWKRSIKKQESPCWRRSLTDWRHSEQWAKLKGDHKKNIGKTEWCLLCQFYYENVCEHFH